MLALSMLWLYTQNFLPMCAHYFFKLSSTIRRSVILRPIDAQLVNLARDGVAADAQAYRGIVLAAVRVSQRGLDQRRFELAAERVHHFGAVGCLFLCGFVFLLCFFVWVLFVFVVCCVFWCCCCGGCCCGCLC